MDASPSISFQSALPSSADPHVVSVVANGSNSCIWNFDTAVASVGPGLGVGLAADGEDGNGVTQTGANQIRIDYTSAKSPGDGWYVTGPYDGVQFVGGGLLPDGGGVLIA